jgi:methyl-accepting chemotaxis protein
MLQQAAADLLALGFGVFTARAITSALTRVRRSSERLADGDVTAATGVDQKDDVGRMAAALDSARENLRGLVASVASAADAVAADLLSPGRADQAEKWSSAVLRPHVDNSWCPSSCSGEPFRHAIDKRDARRGWP